jgi:hypothetical protein
VPPVTEDAHVIHNFKTESRRLRMRRRKRNSDENMTQYERDGVLRGTADLLPSGMPGGMLSGRREEYRRLVVVRGCSLLELLQGSR